MGRGTSDCAAATTRVSRRTTKPNPSAPSKLARAAAEAAWPQVQDQRKIAQGVFGFSCAGHGGIIAVIGVADLTEEMVEAARKTGKVELILEHHAGRSVRRWSSEKYVADGLRARAEQSPDRYTLTELWVGEEDCDWATILYANPDLIQKSIDAGHHAASLDLEQVRRSVETWNERFLAEIEPDHVPIPGGQIDKEQRKEKILGAGGFVRDSHELVEDDLVDVHFKDAEGARRTYRMNRSVYGEIAWDEVASPEDFREIGEIKLLS